MVIAISIACLLLASGTLAGLCAGLILALASQQLNCKAEASRQATLLSEAMARLQARSNHEYVTASAQEKAADLQLKMLEDALEKEKQGAKNMEKALDPEPREVTGFDSEGHPVVVDMNDGWEIVE